VDHNTSLYNTVVLYITIVIGIHAQWLRQCDFVVQILQAIPEEGHVPGAGLTSNEFVTVQRFPEMSTW